MKFLFIVQGEGRGHMTQAISFSKMLKRHGHELTGAIVGKSQRRSIPDFFIQQIDAEIFTVESPNFVTDKAEKQILIGKTIVHNIKKSKTFYRSLSQIHQIVEDQKPDILLNFYDLLGGLYNALYQPKISYWVIGHQYLSEHPDFIFAESKAFAKQCFQFNTWLTGIGAEKKLGLSFRKFSEINHSKLIVAPPLLRPEVKNLKPSQGDFYLAYMVNPGYAEEVKTFALNHPEIKIKAYWDKKGVADIIYPVPNLSIHQVHDQHFLRDMASCKGLVCTAGFESVCEAMYLEKPVLVIPVKGQYEQACNALDTVASGAGISSENFDFLELESLADSRFSMDESPKEWEEIWENLLPQILPQTKMTEPSLILTQSFS